jgi:hypothetical protein
VAFSHSWIISSERLHAKDIVGDRMIGTQPKHRFRFTSRVNRTSLLLRLSGTRQMLLDRHLHAREMTVLWSRGQAWLARQRSFAHKQRRW